MPDLTAHMWVVLIVVPIEIEVEGDTLHTYTREGGEELARDDAEIICFNCKTALTTDTYNTECAEANNLASSQ